VSHKLLVSRDPDDADGVVGSVVCSGVTDACRTWWECREEHDWNRVEFERFTDAVDEGDDMHHGVEHRVIDYVVMVPSVQCLAHTMNSGLDSAHEAAQGLEPGEYPCDVTYEGDEMVLVSVVRKAAAS
jgi:hypothetical protein